MDHFNYQHDQLFAEDVAVQDLVAEYGSPLFVYSRATIERHFRVFTAALAQQPHLICYAVKANSNLAILNILAKLGSGFDIVSGGELARVLAAGGDPQKVVFSGVGKTTAEMQAALTANIYCFNIESRKELLRLEQVARDMQTVAPISVRVNPDINANTHPYISTGLKHNKFGVDRDEALEIYQLASQSPYLHIKGIDCHIGSQLLSVAPLIEAFKFLMQLRAQLTELGIRISHVDLGGGLGVRYRDEQAPLPEELGKELLANQLDPTLKIILEPGRAIVANAGILVTKVEYLKQTEIINFAIVDAGMNDYIRPSLYQASQTVVPVQQRKGTTQCYDIVGPVCETGDFLAKNVELAVTENDLLAIRTAGAYGSVMSSNYNSRPRAAEVMVDGNKHYLIRKRETEQELFQHEIIPA